VSSNYAIKRDDKYTTPPPLVQELVTLLAERITAADGQLQIHDTAVWGSPDLDIDVVLHLVTGATRYFVKPWNLNLALVLEGAPVPEHDQHHYDLICELRGQCLAEARLQPMPSPLQSVAPPEGSGIPTLLRAVPNLRAAVAERIAATMKQARNIATWAPLEVSVLLPTSGADSLQDAVTSVLTQSYHNLELLVIQDGGVNMAPLLAPFDDPRLTLLPQSGRLGKAAALNRALRKARGKCIAYLDDDTIWYPEHLATLMRALCLLPGVRLAHSDGWHLERRRTPSGWEAIEASRSLHYTGHVALEDILEFNRFLGITVVHDKTLIDAAGSFDSRLDDLVDFDMWRRLAALTHPCHVSQVTAEHYAWADEDPDRSGIADLAGQDLPRYLANRVRILSKPLPGKQPEATLQRWATLKRKARFDFLLHRGISLFREHNLPARARAALRLARAYCPKFAAPTRRLGIALLEVGEPAAAMTLLQRCIRDASARCPADYLYAGLASIQRGRPLEALDLFHDLEREFTLSPQERELMQRYRDLARKASTIH
jgi:hypothetical protein